jgi:hypothetical protein
MIREVDPFVKSTGTEITSSNIGSSGAGTWATDGGDKFTAAKLVDIYNLARLALFDAYRLLYGNTNKLSEEVNEQLVTTSAFQFILTGSVSVGAKPAGYLKFVSLMNASNVKINLLPIAYKDDVIQGVKSLFTQSAAKMFVFDIGSNLIHYGTYVTSLSTYQLSYYGLTLYAVSDVTGGATVESFTDKDVPKILELAQAIANEQGLQQVNALASKLIGGQ